jgi:hypothetical protein
MDYRARLALGFWPRIASGRLGVSAGISYGPGVTIARLPGGRYTDTSISLSIATRLSLLRSVSLEPALGGALHLTAIDGAPGMPSVHVEDSQSNPSVDGSLVLGFDLGSRVQIGLWGQMAYFVRSQHYLVQSAPVFTPSDLQIDAGLRLAVGID